MASSMGYGEGGRGSTSGGGGGGGGGGGEAKRGSPYLTTSMAPSMNYGEGSGRRTAPSGGAGAGAGAGAATGSGYGYGDGGSGARSSASTTTSSMGYGEASRSSNNEAPRSAFSGSTAASSMGYGEASRSSNNETPRSAFSGSTTASSMGYGESSRSSNNEAPRSTFSGSSMGYGEGARSSNNEAPRPAFSGSSMGYGESSRSTASSTTTYSSMGYPTRAGTASGGGAAAANAAGSVNRVAATGFGYGEGRAAAESTTTSGSNAGPNPFAESTSSARGKGATAATLQDAAADAVESAGGRLAQILQTPADLHLVEQLQERFDSDKATKDGQLKAAVRTHLDSAAAGLTKMHQATDDFSGIKAHFAALDTLCAQSQELLSMYPLIKQVYQAHRRFAETVQVCDELAVLPATLQELDRLVTQDTHNLLAARHLLYVFRELVRIDQLQASLFARAATATDAVRRDLREHFRGVAPIVAAFEQLLFNLAGKLFQLTRKHPATIVKIVKIVEAAERVDAATAIAAATTTAAPTSGGTPPTVPTPRGYRARLFQRIQQANEERFEGGVVQFSGNVEGTLRALNLMTEDLTLVMDEIVPRFPPGDNIFQAYVDSYHRLTVGVLIELARGPLDPKDILLMFNWVEAYHRNLQQRLGVDPERLHPRLLDEQVPKLIGDYVQLVHSKVEEWTRNLLAVESRDFHERKQPPEQDPAGLYVTAAPTILFQMMNQQVDLAAKAGREGLLVDVVIECCDVMADFQTAMTEMVRGEERKYVADPETHVGGLIEYTMAFVNVMARCSDLSVQMLERLKGEVRGPGILILEKRLGEIEEGFRTAAKAGLQTLATIIFMDVHSFMDACFTLRWYDHDLLESVTATLEDYAADLQTHLLEYYFTKFMYECLDRVLVNYLSAAVAKTATLKGNGAAAAKVTTDMRVIATFFSKYIIEKRVTRTLTVLNDLLQVLTAVEPAAISTAVATLRSHHADTPQAYLDILLHKRADLPHNRLQRITADLAASYAETPVAAMAPGDEPSVLARARLPA